MTVEPITLSDVQLQTRIPDLSVESDLIDVFISAIRETAESVTRRSLVVKQQVLTLNAFPLREYPIEIPNPPLRSIDSIIYTDSDLNEITLDPSLYRIIFDTQDPEQPSVVVPAYGNSWPVAVNDLSVVKITYTSGYGDIPYVLNKGNLDCSEVTTVDNTDPLNPITTLAYPDYPAAIIGDQYTISVAGKIGGNSGVSVSLGDVITCVHITAGGDQATVGSHWEFNKEIDSKDLPKAIKQWMLLNIANLYEHRETVAIGNRLVVLDISSIADALIANYRVARF